MDMMKKLFGARPALYNRGTVGTSILNVSDAAQNIDLGVTFDAAYKLDISSSSAADAAAGTGMRKVEIYGLDYAGIPINESVTLNGQTAVQSTKSFWRVILAKIDTAGTGRKNAGDIYIVKTGTGGTYTAGVPGTLTSCIIKILVGLNLGTSGIWTAPLGMIYTIDSLVAQCRVQAGRIQVFHASERTAPIQLPHPEIDIDAGVSGPSPIPTPNTFIINELEDIYFKATMAAASGIVSIDAFLRQISPSSPRY